MSQPTVSVITVVWNANSSGRADKLKQSIASVAAQDYPNIEHIVIDGASTDGTLDVLRPYAEDGRINLISEPDNGIYDAMNKGIARARGKYIAFLNSDDYWHGTRGVSSSVEILEKTGATFSYAPSIWLDADDNYLVTNVPQIGLFYAMMPFCHQTMFTRTDKLREYGGFDNNTFRSVADYDLICRMLVSGERPVYNPYIFTTFRMGGFSNTNDDQTQLRLTEDRIMRQRVFKHLTSPELAAQLSTQRPLSASFSKALEMVVHPAVAVQMERCLERHSSLTDKFSIIDNAYDGNAYQEELYEKTAYKFPFSISNKRKILLFGFLPLLTHIYTEKWETWKLFDFLLLLKVRKAHSRKSYLLMGFIPIFIERVCRR